MVRTFLDTDNLPFCKGCSHQMIARSTEKALQILDIDPLDVVLVTDIGCHGIIDRKFHTHTVHGLHGRSVALAAGVSAGLADPSKKVIVYIGDGGTSIGINHLLGAAHRNFDMTVVVHNNMLYGMTGGQQSDLTPGSFNIRASMSGFTDEYLDVLKLVEDAGAAYVSRIQAKGDFSEELAKAMRVPGFSLVEVLEVCPSYGLKQNKEVTVANISEKFDLPLTSRLNENAKKAEIADQTNNPSLLDSMKPVSVEFGHNLQGQFTLLMGGSAGEGVQVAADIFATAAMSCGLNVTKKGSYPVTVGTGYSAVEIIVSPEEIVFTGIGKADWAVVSSEDGMSFLKKRIEGMSGGRVITDAAYTVPGSEAIVHAGDFRGQVPGREINLAMAIVMLGISGIFPAEAMVKAISENKIGGKMDVAKLVAASDALRGQIAG